MNQLARGVQYTRNASHLVRVFASATAHHARASEPGGVHVGRLLVARHVADLLRVAAVSGGSKLALVVALRHAVVQGEKHGRRELASHVGCVKNLMTLLTLPFLRCQ